MRWIVLLFLAAPFMAEARAPGLIVGVGFDVGTTGDSPEFFGDLSTIVDRLGGEFQRDTGGMRPALRLGYQFSAWFALEVRTRLLSTSASGTFEGLSTLDFEISRTVIPIQLLPRVTVDGGPLGFALGIGPGLYYSRSRQRGHLGDGQSSEFTFGFAAEAALALHASDHVVLELTAKREHFELGQTNALIQNGGTVEFWSGGVSLAYTFGG